MRAMSTESVSSESTASRVVRSSLRAGSRAGGGLAAGTSSSRDARVSRSESQPPLLRPLLAAGAGFCGRGSALSAPSGRSAPCRRWLRRLALRRRADVRSDRPHFGAAAARGVGGFGLAPHRFGGIERAAVAGDDAIELGQGFDLIDDDAAHLRRAFGGLLRQFEDAATQFGARHLELLLHSAALCFMPG